MSGFDIDPTLAVPALIMAKATLLIGMAAIIVLVGRRVSAAARHWALTLALGSLLALPVLAAMLPEWGVWRLQVESGAAATAPASSKTDGLPADMATADPVSASTLSSPAAGDVTEPAPTHPWSAWSIAAAIYGGVAFLLLARLAIQIGAAARVARQRAGFAQPEWRTLLDEGCALLGIRRDVRLIRSGPETMPMAIGTWRPAIVLPSVADSWTDERRRAVLLHELSHVARRDCLTQLLAGLACALYWPHPGVWWLARRLRVERELACDDLVLRAGTPAADYAGHLLDVAYTLGGARSGALAVGMARRSQLEGRMLAVLDSARNRALPGPGVRMTMAATALAALVPLAVASVSSEPLANLDLEPGMHSAPLAASVATQAPASAAVRPHEPLTAPHLKPAPWARLAAAAAEQVSGLASRGSGSWSIAPSRDAGEVYLEMREGRSRSGTTVKLAGLEGLSESQLSSGGAVKFAIRRDAGTFTFEGTVKDGHGGGTFSFAANQAFPAELEKRGIGRPSPEEQYELARHDVGLALVDELARRGYARPTVADLVKAGHHGVRVDYVREMAELGYTLGTLEPLITLRDHGVTPSFARGLASHGFTKIPADELRRVRDHGVTPDFIGELKGMGAGNLTLEQFVKVRDHGVTPKYIAEMRALGYGSLPIETLVKARDHGVTPEFVEGLAAGGYGKLPLDEVMRTRDHGVTPEFIKGLKDLGYSGLALQDVVRTRDHGVTPEFLREMHALGHKAPLADLVKARDHGVTPGYARELKTLGYDGLSLGDLIMLRDHGVTPEKVKRANERAGTKLPADMLRSLANGGWK